MKRFSMYIDISIYIEFSFWHKHSYTFYPCTWSM
nr:MAG TPA: hypothetical protein [Caudoviricetes sp.]